MEKKYIPVEVIQDKKINVWYLDISNLSLSELTKLRNTLSSTQDYSVRMLDGIIYDLTGIGTNLNHQYKENKKAKKLERKTKHFKNYKHHKHR